jgi:hypothetical protein
MAAWPEQGEAEWGRVGDEGKESIVALPVKGRSRGDA